MGQASNRRVRRNEAQKRLNELFKDQHSLNVVHYSCESFYDNPAGASRRVTSIAVLSAGAGQATSFSIHHMAERKKIAPDDLHEHYDSLEKSMLAEFYKYVSDHPNNQWLHWNMRDTNYGFPAIEHRYRVLSGTPVPIPESHLFDLADAFVDIYGEHYIGHRRLENLMRLNEITDRDFLSGAEEAEAFESREYVKLHQSTLRKIRVIHALAARGWDRRLRTDARLWQRHGASIGGLVEDLTDHWGYKLVAGVGLVWGIILSAIAFF